MFHIQSRAYQRETGIWVFKITHFVLKGNSHCECLHVQIEQPLVSCAAGMPTPISPRAGWFGNQSLSWQHNSGGDRCVNQLLAGRSWKLDFTVGGCWEETVEDVLTSSITLSGGTQSVLHAGWLEAGTLGSSWVNTHSHPFKGETRIWKFLPALSAVNPVKIAVESACVFIWTVFMFVCLIFFCRTHESKVHCLS